MREIRSSGSVEGVMSNHDPYSEPTRWNHLLPDLATHFYCARQLHELNGLEPVSAKRRRTSSAAERLNLSMHVLSRASRSSPSRDSLSLRPRFHGRRE